MASKYIFTFTLFLLASAMCSAQCVDTLMIRNDIGAWENHTESKWSKFYSAKVIIMTGKQAIARYHVKGISDNNLYFAVESRDGIQVAKTPIKILTEIDCEQIPWQNGMLQGIDKDGNDWQLCQKKCKD